MLSTIMKKSKMNYYNHYFETNWDNIKNTKKSKKSILNITNRHSNIPKILVFNDTTSAELIEIANNLNNFFTSIRAYFRKEKCPGMGHFLKKCPFQKWQIQPTPAPLGHPNGLLLNKGALLFK